MGRYRGRDLAGEYERRFPETGCGEAQKEERMERLLLKREWALHGPPPRRRMRGIIITRDLPWAGKRKATP